MSTHVQDTSTLQWHTVEGLFNEREELLALLRIFQEHVVAWAAVEGAPPLPSMLVDALRRVADHLG